MRVLYVDDQANSDAFDSLKDLLTDEGIEVVFETTVGGTLLRLREKRVRYDAIILDVIMPPFGTYTLSETEGGLATGFRLLEDLKRECPGIPVVVVSIKRNEGGEALKKRLGVADYLEKPVDIANLVQSIRRVARQG